MRLRILPSACAGSALCAASSTSTQPCGPKKGGKQQFGKGGGKYGKFGKGKGGAGGQDGAKGQGKGQAECWEFKKHGTCRFGETCKFAHGQVEKREAPDEGGREAKKPRSR